MLDTKVQLIVDDEVYLQMENEGGPAGGNILLSFYSRKENAILVKGSFRKDGIKRAIRLLETK